VRQQHDHISVAVAASKVEALCDLIRELIKADRTIRDAQTDLPEVKRIGVPLSQLKDYGDVVLHQMLVASGREAMRKDYERDPWDRPPPHPSGTSRASMPTAS
jgi:Leu/Phe-tRNA-protein transferase